MDKYKFGNKLTEYRTERGLTQSELGEILGVSNKAVSKWENGSAMPRLDMMSKITEFFGVSIDEFLDNPVKSENAREMEEKYLKLYNEKMKRRKIIKILLFVVLPALIVLVNLFYVFAPPLIVRMKYASLPDYAKIKAVDFHNYETVFTNEDYEKDTPKEISLNSGTVFALIPSSFTVYEKLESDEFEKHYSASTENTDKQDLFSFSYFKDEGLEHFDYVLNFEDEWFSENYDGMHYRMYDLKWLFYNFDWKNSTKLCDWRKSVMSYQILMLQGIGAPKFDKVINYNGENAKGFIMWATKDADGNERTAPIYMAELYNDNGDSITVKFCEKNNSDACTYETFCKIVNSVRFSDPEEEKRNEETERWKDAYDMVESDNERMARWRDDLPYVTPNPDLEILKAEEVTTLSLKAGMDENDIINTLGEPEEIEFKNEDGFNKKIYVYDGVRITFLKEYLDEPYMDEIWSAEITDPDAVFPRDIKIGDSLESILKKFPQERDKDYRLDGKVYGDGMYKFTDGFASVREQEQNGEPQKGRYQLNISCGYWPEIDFILDNDLNVEKVIIYYISMGIG